MKKILYLILLAIVFASVNLEVNASSGQLRKNSIKTCNGIMYGKHSSDNHWHVAEKSDGKYYATGSPIYSDPCASASNSSASTGSINNTTSNGNTSTSKNSSSNNESNDNPSTNNNITTQNKVKSNDNTLKTINIDGTEVNVEDNIDYSTTNEYITIKVTTNDENTKYEIKNNNNLEIGNNKVSIEVTAENGSLKIYNINVKREKVLSSDTSIKIFVDDNEVNFDNNKAIVNVSSSKTNVKIDYTLSDENAKVEMDKIDELKTGDNIINIKVTAEDGTEEDYELIIHKDSKNEDVVSTILGLAIIGGIGYGICLIIKKVIL